MIVLDIHEFDLSRVIYPVFRSLAGSMDNGIGTNVANVQTVFCLELKAELKVEKSSTSIVVPLDLCEDVFGLRPNDGCTAQYEVLVEHGGDGDFSIVSWGTDYLFNEYQRYLLLPDHSKVTIRAAGGCELRSQISDGGSYVFANCSTGLYKWYPVAEVRMCMTTKSTVKWASKNLTSINIGSTMLYVYQTWGRFVVGT